MTCWSGSVSWHVRQEVIHEMYVRHVRQEVVHDMFVKRCFMTCLSGSDS